MHVFHCGWSFWVEQRADVIRSTDTRNQNRLTVDVSV